jgi:hypothetical protein
MRVGSVAIRLFVLVEAFNAASTACDEQARPEAHPEAATTAASIATARAASATPVADRAPDIVVDAASVAVGTDHVPATELGLEIKLAVFLTGRPAIEGHTVDVVAMRNARPSAVAAVVGALQQAKASGVGVKSEARDNSTQRLPLSFDTDLPACTVIAWIAKDAAIDVWPVGGARAKKIYKGLAGPDVTLGTDAVRNAWTRCDSSDIVVGADDAMTWGLVFDLATTVLQAPGARASRAVLITKATPGRKLMLSM